ncbi:hypothetical protein [Acaryochloris thomasi]|uniref:hypothetical protein n=1 Tax=Acaryochloris thomasi TaxID=2929456 RepID=UPI0013147C03|nr:hypothetical protein [Acaryochloris thomasi]
MSRRELRHSLILTHRQMLLLLLEGLNSQAETGITFALTLLINAKNSSPTPEQQQRDGRNPANHDQR